MKGYEKVYEIEKNVLLKKKFLFFYTKELKKHKAKCQNIINPLSKFFFCFIYCGTMYFYNTQMTFFKFHLSSLVFVLIDIYPISYLVCHHIPLQKESRIPHRIRGGDIEFISNFFQKFIFAQKPLKIFF